MSAACSTCDGSGYAKRPSYLYAGEPCPECSASAMRAQRDEARLILIGTQAAVTEALDERDAARTALAALLDALPRCMGQVSGGECQRPATLAWSDDEGPCRCRNHIDPGWTLGPVDWADAIEAAERELGRRER